MCVFGLLARDRWALGPTGSVVEPSENCYQGLLARVVARRGRSDRPLVVDAAALLDFLGEHLPR